MAGGANEYVMGVLKTQDGTGLAYSSSGFTTSTLPLGSKYVDAYTFGTSSRDYTRRILGDATGETRGWYSDYAVFPNYYFSFFKRGAILTLILTRACSAIMGIVGSPTTATLSVPF